MGPAIATRIILNSALKHHFRLIHLQTRLNKDLKDMGSRNALKLLRLFWQYFNYILKIIFHNPDLVLIPISQSWSGFKKDAAFIKLGSILRRKMLIHLRGSNFKNFYLHSTAGKQEYIANVLGKSVGAIVLGENLRYIFEDFFPPTEIFVVPNGADYEITVPEKKETVFRIVYLGNLQPSKGIEDVVESLILLPEEYHKSVLLVVVGAWRDEATKARLRSRIAEYDLPVNFKDVHVGKDKLKILTDSDVLIFPPREPEGHPWVIIEAMAAGLPVIATDQGAIVESVADGRNGYIVPKRDPEAIAEKIRFLLENPDIRRKMGEESRKLYQEKFTEEKMVVRLRQVFTEVIEKK